MEKNCSDVTDLVQADRLIAEYWRVAEGVASLLATGAPDSLLPAPRDELRQAILAVARQACAFSPGDALTLDRLRRAYASLASFLPYEQALAAARLLQAFQTGDRQYLSCTEAVAAMTRARQIELEATHLAREFDRFVCQQQTAEFDGLDEFLATLARKYAIAGG